SHSPRPPPAPLRNLRPCFRSAGPGTFPPPARKSSIPARRGSVRPPPHPQTSPHSFWFLLALLPGSFRLLALYVSFWNACLFLCFLFWRQQSCAGPQNPPVRPVLLSKENFAVPRIAIEPPRHQT